MSRGMLRRSRVDGADPTGPSRWGPYDTALSQQGRCNEIKPRELIRWGRSDVAKPSGPIDGTEPTGPTRGEVSDGERSDGVELMGPIQWVQA